jgi:hypothetical protein
MAQKKKKKKKKKKKIHTNFKDKNNILTEKKKLKLQHKRPCQITTCHCQQQNNPYCKKKKKKKSSHLFLFPTTKTNIICSINIFKK